MDIKFGITPPSNLWRKSLKEKQDVLAAIAASGFNHMYLADHVSFRNGSGTDGFVNVAALSQLHDTLGVMISIYLLPLRHPLPVARQLASMHDIAPGRMMFGVGVGGEDRHEIEVCGVDPSTRGQRTNESLQIIRQLLQGDNVTFKGKHFDLTDALIKPRVDPAIPIIIGGRSNAALERTGRFGDGWVGVWCSERRYAEAVTLIQTTAERHGRGKTQWLHGYQPWVGVHTHAGQAQQAVKKQMEAFYKVPFEKFARYTPFGTPREVAEQLVGYAAAGCRMFNLKICTPDPEEEPYWGGEVLSELKRLAQSA